MASTVQSALVQVLLNIIINILRDIHEPAILDIILGHKGYQTPGSELDYQPEGPSTAILTYRVRIMITPGRICPGQEQPS